LEIIEIMLVKPVLASDQPENWLLESAPKPRAWQSHGFFAWKEIDALLDKPAGLWNDKTELRRVKVGYPQSMNKPASLYLIKPESIQSIKIWSEPNPFEPAKPVKRHRQLILRYAGISHEFDIDDVDFADKHYPNFPGVNEPAVYPKLRNPAETLICVSLTPEFHGHHYKIAAAFFEPPQ
jgi:hypothetical protein